MADAKITALTATTTGAMSSSDVFVLVDVSDTTMAASGTDKKIRTDELSSTVATLVPAGGLVPGQIRNFTSSVSSFVYANYLPLVADGKSVENVGAIESNVNTVAATGSTETLDTSLYAVHDCTMDQSCTFTFSNPAPSGKNTTFMLILRGAFTPTFPASVDWPDAAAPTYSTPTIYVFTTVDAGTTWLGQSVGKALG